MLAQPYASTAISKGFYPTAVRWPVCCAVHFVHRGGEHGLVLLAGVVVWQAHAVHTLSPSSARMKDSAVVSLPVVSSAPAASVWSGGPGGPGLAASHRLFTEAPPFVLLLAVTFPSF